MFECQHPLPQPLPPDNRHHPHNLPLNHPGVVVSGAITTINTSSGNTTAATAISLASSLEEMGAGGDSRLVPIMQPADSLYIDEFNLEPLQMSSQIILPDMDALRLNRQVWDILARSAVVFHLYQSDKKYGTPCCRQCLPDGWMVDSLFIVDKLIDY